MKKYLFLQSQKQRDNDFERKGKIKNKFFDLLASSKKKTG